MNTRSPRYLSALRSFLILLALAVAPAWAQDNKSQSAPQKNSTQETQHQKNERGAKPSGEGARSNPGNKAGESKNTGRPTRAMNQPSTGRGENPPQEGGNRPAYTHGGQNRPATGENKPHGGQNPPAPAAQNKPRGGQGRPGPATGENKPQGGQNRPAPTAGQNFPQGGHGRPAPTTARKFTPPKGATSKPNAYGGRDYVTQRGTQFNTGKSGNLTSLRTKSGTVARFNASGRVARIQTNRITINQGPRGARTVVTRLPNGGRVVTLGRRQGYVERPYMRAGRPYINRTYIYRGRTYAVVYRGYYWHGRPYYRYVPPYYYALPFYVWAYHPWPAPIYWGWGWGGAPWYGYYGYYFAPYPVYPSPIFWLTDFVLAAELQEAYEDQLEANAEAYYPPPAANQNVTLTPEVKQAIADEVQAQLAAQQAAAQAPAGAPSSEQPPDALDPKTRTFIVSNTMSETMADGTACSLSPGDVLTRISDTPDANQNVTVMVTTSQNGDCAAGTQLAMSVQDLQDMLNGFRQNLNNGLQSLSNNQGKKGMPSSPAPGQTAAPDGTAQPDPNAASQIDQTDQDANQVEQDVQQSQQEPNQ